MLMVVGFSFFLRVQNGTIVECYGFRTIYNVLNFRDTNNCESSVAVVHRKEGEGGGGISLKAGEEDGRMEGLMSWMKCSISRSPTV